MAALNKDYSKPSRTSSVQTLRQFVNDRLAAAAREIFGAFELTVSELEEEVGRQRKLLDGLLKPAVLLQKRDAQQWLVKEEELPVQQQWSSKLEEPEPTCVQQVEEENQEVGQKKDVANFPFNIVVVKIGDDAAAAQSSQLHQREEEPPTSSITQHMMTESDQDSCRGPEPASYLDPGLHSEHQRSLFSNTDTDDSDDWKETSNAPSGSSSVEKADDPKSNKQQDADDKSLSCSGCNKRCFSWSGLTRHKKICKGEKMFSCSVCEKSFSMKGALVKHTRIHTGEKLFFCLVCGKGFMESGKLKIHVRIHTGEKPFSCSVCGKRFNEKGNLKIHVRIHTGEKPFSCSECGKCFNQATLLKTHRRRHTGEKPFRCSKCGKQFTLKSSLKTHMMVHLRARSSISAQASSFFLFPEKKC